MKRKSHLPCLVTSRRGFLRAGWALVVGFFLGVGGVVLRFLFPKVLYAPPAAFEAGRPEDYQIGMVDNRWKKDHKVMVVRTKEGIYAVSLVCTHLGCTANWFKDEGLFKCPCHGSNFTLEGDVVAGPAPQPLFRVAVSLSPEGTMIIDKSRKENREGKREEKPFFLTV